MLQVRIEAWLRNNFSINYSVTSQCPIVRRADLRRIKSLLMKQK